MLDYALPVLFALLVWWFSTGAILYLVGLPARSYRWTMMGATVVLAASFLELARYGADTSVYGAYASFTCGLMIWAWHEVSFLTGSVTGPRKSGCPDGCGGWRHFVHGVQTILYHELAIIVTGAGMVAVTWGAANQVGTWTFVILWGMRLSAKLNLFLGASNVPEDFLASHLAYLKAFFRKRRMNLLFPVSITISTVVAVFLGERAFGAGATAFDIAAFTLLFSFMVLAILEHWFLMLPVPVTAIWSWGLRSHGSKAARAQIGWKPPIELGPSVPRRTKPAIQGHEQR